MPALGATLSAKLMASTGVRQPSAQGLRGGGGAAAAGFALGAGDGLASPRGGGVDAGAHRRTPGMLGAAGRTGVVCTTGPSACAPLPKPRKRRRLGDGLLSGEARIAGVESGPIALPVVWQHAILVDRDCAPAVHEADATHNALRLSGIEADHGDGRTHPTPRTSRGLTISGMLPPMPGTAGHIVSD